MVCPLCHSATLVGPHYASNLATRERQALMSCADCAGVFDAYTAFGSAPGRARLAA